jgi:hypothetical protein
VGEIAETIDFQVEVFFIASIVLPNNWNFNIPFSISILRPLHGIEQNHVHRKLPDFEKVSNYLNLIRNQAYWTSYFS